MRVCTSKTGFSTHPPRSFRLTVSRLFLSGSSSVFCGGFMFGVCIIVNVFLVSPSFGVLGALSW